MYFKIDIQRPNVKFFPRLISNESMKATEALILAHSTPLCAEQVVTVSLSTENVLKHWFIFQLLTELPSVPATAPGV